MNNLYKRPMFRKGGSAEGGITSGLQSRPGYKIGERVTEVVDEMRTAMPQRNTAKRRFNDFLIDFGLDIATRSPTGSGIGGAISTALASAKDPFSKFQQSRAASESFDDKLALGAYDIIKAEDLAAKKRQQELDDMDRERTERLEELGIKDKYKRGQIELDAELRPKNEKGFEFESKQETLSKLQDGQDVINQQIIEIQTMPATGANIGDSQEKIKQLKRELEKNQQLQKLITGEDDLIGETILKSIAADTGDFDLNDYMEYKNNPDAFLKKLRENKADGGRIGLNLGGMSNKPMMTNIVEEVQETGTTDPVADLSYAELRARLPKEITDDVITTIASSKQALLDFANIRTQQDVDEFNQQYNVNLVLPQEG